MKKTHLHKAGVLALVLLVAGLVFAGSAAAEETPAKLTTTVLPMQHHNTASYVDGQLFVKFDTTEEGMALLNEATVLNDYTAMTPGLVLIKTPEGMTVSKAVSYYKNLPGVIYAEPNYIMTLTDSTEKTTDPTATAAKSPVPVFGILAGLGIAGFAALRRK